MQRDAAILHRKGGYLEASVLPDMCKGVPSSDIPSLFQYAKNEMKLQKAPYRIFSASKIGACFSGLHYIVPDTGESEERVAGCFVFVHENGSVEQKGIVMNGWARLHQDIDDWRLSGKSP